MVVKMNKMSDGTILGYSISRVEISRCNNCNRKFKIQINEWYDTNDQYQNTTYGEIGGLDVSCYCKECTEWMADQEVSIVAPQAQDTIKI